jgi:hypothetical protein
MRSVRPVVGDLDPALLDVDVRGAVFAHGAEFDQVDVGVDLGDRVQEIQGADDVVGLGVDGVRLVDHGVGCGALLGEVHDGVGGEGADGVGGELGVAQVSDVTGDVLAGQLRPRGQPDRQGLDRHQALDPELLVVATAGEVVDNADLVAGRRQVQCCGPAEIAVRPEDQDPHENRLHCLARALQTTAIYAADAECPLITSSKIPAHRAP